MGFTSRLGYGQGLIFLLVASASVLATASNTIVVGGSEGWKFGFDYTKWSEQNDFHLNDTLVFKYDPPNSTTFPHSVYLMRNLWSYEACDLKTAKIVANVTDGGGEGFKFVLKELQPHYFACGERNGFHCKAGGMRFIASPRSSFP